MRGMKRVSGWWDGMAYMDWLGWIGRPSLAVGYEAWQPGLLPLYEGYQIGTKGW